MGTYKTNWQLTETVMPEDMNRIEENTKENNNALSEFKKQYNADSKEENKKIDKKSEKEDVILKVPYPEDRDCNSFKTLNAFCAFDTGIGDFKNTPEGTLAYGSAKVFVLTNRGYVEGRIQQEFVYVYPQDHITKWVRNFNSDNGGQWGRWWKVYDEANKPTPNDIGAIAKIPPRLTKDLNTATTSGLYVVDRAPHAPQSYGRLLVLGWDNDQKWVTQVFFSDIQNKVYVRCSTNNTATEWTSWAEQYSTKFKPTPEAIGALPTEGGRMTGNLEFAGCTSPIKITGFQGANGLDYHKNNGDRMGSIGMLGDTTQGELTRAYMGITPTPWDGVNSLTVGVEGAYYNNQKIYHAGNKPTAEDVGAVSKSGGTMTGNLFFAGDYCNSPIGVFMVSDVLMNRGLEYYDKSKNFMGGFGATANGTKIQKIYLGTTRTPWDGNKTLTVDENGVYFNNQKLYYAGNKPTPREIGASPTGHNHDSAYLGKTATAVNSNRLANLGLYDSSTGTQGIPNVGNDGVMEVGRMIDFHEAGTNKDFNTRLESINGALKCWQDFSAISLWAQKYLRINDWYGGSEDGRFYYKQEGKQLRTENIETLYVNGSAVAKGDYWDVGESTRVFNLGGGLRLVRQWIGTNASNSAGGVSYTIHFPKAWSWVIPISLVSDNMANTNIYTSGYCTIDALSNVHLNGGCYQMTPGKSTRIHLTYLAGE